MSDAPEWRRSGFTAGSDLPPPRTNWSNATTRRTQQDGERGQPASGPSGSRAQTTSAGPAQIHQQSHPNGRSKGPEDVTAIAQGRRVYIGSIRYFATELDVRELFKDFEIEHVAISIDPFTHRNPGYAFINLARPEEAEKAVAALTGRELLGRPFKISVAVERGARGDRPPQASRDQRSNGQQGPPANLPERWSAPGKARAVDASVNASAEGRRLFVGNCPPHVQTVEVQEEVRAFFEGFAPTAISKINPPPAKGPNDRTTGGAFLFVDFADAETARSAIAAYNGKPWRGYRLKLDLARHKELRKTTERARWERENSAAPTPAPAAEVKEAVASAEAPAEEKWEEE